MKIKLTKEARRIEKLTGINFAPERATSMSAGLDLKACIDIEVIIYSKGVFKIPTGVHIWLETPNLAGLILPRSSCKQFVLTNTVGLVDGDYQGEIFVSVRNVSLAPLIINPGDKIAQFVITKICSDKLEFVKEFEYETSRGQNGFGSTGK